MHRMSRLAVSGAVRGIKGLIQGWTNIAIADPDLETDAYGMVTGWHNGNALDLYSGGARFKSQPGHQPSWQVFRGFPQSFQSISRILPLVGHDHFCPNPFQFVWHPTTQHCSVNTDNIATGYELDDRGQSSSSGRVKNFSLLHVVETGSWANPASFPMGTGGKAAGAWSWPLTN
jgi:hypothetical protein